MPISQPILHIFGQNIPHDDVIIKGNKLGLTSLRDLINDALNKGEDESEFMVCDGEYYDLTIQLKEDTKDLPLPYKADWFEKSFEKRKYEGNDEEI